eukprot:4753193-Pyramimonas_sp.AAC.1
MVGRCDLLRHPRRFLVRAKVGVAHGDSGLDGSIDVKHGCLGNTRNPIATPGSRCSSGRPPPAPSSPSRDSTLPVGAL